MLRMHTPQILHLRRDLNHMVRMALIERKHSQRAIGKLFRYGGHTMSNMLNSEKTSVEWYVGVLNSLGYSVRLEVYDELVGRGEHQAQDVATGPDAGDGIPDSFPPEEDPADVDGGEAMGVEQEVGADPPLRFLRVL